MNKQVIVIIVILLLVLGMTKVNLPDTKQITLSYVFNDLGQNKASITYPLTGDNGDDNSFNLISLPINPTSIKTPQELLMATDNRCYFIGTFDTASQRRHQFSTIDPRSNSLTSIEGGKVYLVRCKGKLKSTLTIEGELIDKPILTSSSSPNWVAIPKALDKIRASDFIQRFSTKEFTCSSVKSLVDQAQAFKSGDSLDKDFDMLSSTGYEVKCQKDNCPNTSSCQADIDKNGTVTDLDIGRLKNCLDQGVKSQQPNLWRALSCESTIYDINQDGIKNNQDLDCLDSKILQNCLDKK